MYFIYYILYYIIVVPLTTKPTMQAQGYKVAQYISPRHCRGMPRLWIIKCKDISNNLTLWLIPLTTKPAEGWTSGPGPVPAWRVLPSTTVFYSWSSGSWLQLWTDCAPFSAPPTVSCANHGCNSNTKVMSLTQGNGTFKCGVYGCTGQYESGGFTFISFKKCSRDELFSFWKICAACISSSSPWWSWLSKHLIPDVSAIVAGQLIK